MVFFGGDYSKKAIWKKKVTSVALWISLNLVDVVVTMIAIDEGFLEGNPVVAWIARNITALVGYKVALTLLAIVLLSYLQKAHLLRWLNIIMAAVVGWNLVLLCIS